MKKFLGVSFAAMLAVSPMMANAAGAPTTSTAAALTAKTAEQISANAGNMATASYVMGAYNAIVEEHNDVIDDITVSTAGNYIGTGTGVAENLGRLEEAIKNLEGAAGNAYVTKTSAAATAVEGKTLQYVSADGEQVGDNLGKLDNAIATNAIAISAETIRAEAAEDALDDKIDAETLRATTAEGDLTNLSNTFTGTERDNLVSAINAVAADVASLDGAAATAYQLKTDSNVATAGTHILAGQGVGTNLTRLDGAVDVVERKQIPYVSDWSTGTVNNVMIEDLATGTRPNI